MSRKVAIITGGGKHLDPPPRPPIPNKSIASGIGLAAATHLAATSDWDNIIIAARQNSGKPTIRPARLSQAGRQECGTSSKFRFVT